MARKQPDPTDITLERDLLDEKLAQERDPVVDERNPTLAEVAPESAPGLDEKLADFTEDTLAELAKSLAENGKRQLKMASQAYFELTRRLQARGATVLDTEHWDGKLRAGALIHTVHNAQHLREQLSAYVDAKILDAIFVPRLAVRDQRLLTDLAKRGGAIAEIIADERETVRGEPKLELTRKPEES